MNKYDLVISLGQLCDVADALKKLKITEKTYPFDWSDCEGNASDKLLQKCNLIKNHFKNAFDLKDFIEYHSSDSRMRGVKNIKTGLHYIHDFPWETSVKDFFPTFLEKHLRRVKRLYDDIEKANNVLFVYHDTTKSLPLKSAQKAIKILKDSFPKQNINLLIFLPLTSTLDTTYQEIRHNTNNLFLFMHSKQCGENYSEILHFFTRIIKTYFNNDYCSFANEKELIYSGLSYIESFGRWSDGDSIFFRLQTTKQNEKVSVSINVNPFVCPARPNQKCKIICNGHEIQDIVFDKPDKQEINMIVPNDNNGNLDFVFEFDNTQSPKELGLSEDNRKLGLGFIDAIISENA